jgi:HlyD family secretion protein
VPNAALNFSPSVLEQGIAGFWRRLLPSTRASRPPAKLEDSNQQQTIWILRDGNPIAVSVFVGATDGQRTEILGDNITAGQQVITGFKTDQHQ